jgi:hypothetical protein
MINIIFKKKNYFTHQHIKKFNFNRKKKQVELNKKEVPREDSDM